MKRFLLILSALLLSLSACAQDAPAADAGAGEGQPSAESAAAPEEGNEPADLPEEAHGPVAEPQVIEENSPGGYCGNTVTTARPYGAEADGAYSFWDSDSVALTDLLLTLDYCNGLCRCLPEYTVDTEFGKDYGINLSGFYVRHEGAQAVLTEEQAETIRDILERNMVDENLPQDGEPS